MRLNTLRPAPGSKTGRKRVGRGIGSGTGKTAGRGHKGQSSRSGASQRLGFEGGQMPLQRRLPKRGFRSAKARTVAEVRLHELNRIDDEVVDLISLRKSGLISDSHDRARIVASGELGRTVIVRGIPVSSGAKAAIEKAGGKVEE